MYIDACLPKTELLIQYYSSNSSLETMNTCTIIKSLSIRNTQIAYSAMYNEIWDLDKNSNTSELTLIA